MEWAQRCGKFEDVTLVEKHRVDSRFGVGGAAASSVEESKDDRASSAVVEARCGVKV